MEKRQHEQFSTNNEYIKTPNLHGDLSVEQKQPVQQEQEPERELQGEVEKHNEAGTIDKAIDGLKRTLRIKKKQKPSQIPIVRDETTIQLEKILEEGLGDSFKELTTVQKQEFKIKGEKTAIEIRQLLNGSKVKVKKIYTLLLEWLKMLPGINRYFLQQEAKIKVDKIMALKEQQHTHH